MVVELMAVLYDWMEEDYGDAAGLIDRVDAWMEVAKGVVQAGDRAGELVYPVREERMEVAPLRRLPYDA